MHSRCDLPRLPVLGWAAYTGPRSAATPGILNAPHRRYTLSGRAAISLALRALGAPPDSKVLVPTYYCPTMIAPVLHASMAPLFYPINSYGAPTLDVLERADLTGVRAMLAVHYFGLPQPMAAIRTFCDERRIALIEDCAHAFFGTSDGRPVGTWGDFAVASLPKFFPVPEGGLLASAMRPLNSLELKPRRWLDEAKAAADVVENGSAHGRFPGIDWLLKGVFRIKRFARGRSVAPRTADSPSPLADPLLAHQEAAHAVRWVVESVAQHRIVSLRRRNHALLAHLLSNVAGSRVMSPSLPADAAPYVFPLYVDDPQASYQPLRAAGVPIFRWDELWPGTPAMADDHGTDWATHVFQLGCHQDLSERDVESIAATVKRVVEA